MKPVLKQILISFTSAVIGGLIVFIVFKTNPALHSKLSTTEVRAESAPLAFDDILKKQKSIQNQFDTFFDDQFFGQDDPFEEMRRMREKMQQRMQGNDPAMKNPLDSWFSNKFGGGTVNDISKREDNDFVYYDIKVSDLNSTSINTKVENGNITITGKTEKKSESINDKDGNGFAAQSIYKSTFNRSFPLPDGVDANKMQTVPEKDKIVLKFPKIKT